jgi:hypothetical protein
VVLVARDRLLHDTSFATVVSKLSSYLLKFPSIVAKLVVATTATVIGAANFHVRAHDTLLTRRIRNDSRLL